MKTTRHLVGISLNISSIIAGLLVIFPILYCVCVSFMSPSDLSSFPPKLLPSKLYWDNYKTVFSSTPIFTFMWNSFFVATIGTLLRLLSSSLAAYAFAMMEFRGKTFWFMLMLGTMMIPGDMLIITNYITVANMGLINTYAGIMLVMIASAAFMFILRQHFKTIPRDFRDAAFMDGCGDFRYFTFIVLPISRGILASIFISSFIGLWNAYLWPLLVTNTEGMRTVQVGITMLQFEESMVYGPIMAGVAIILIPSLLIFLVFQKQLIQGVTFSAIKG
jgi:sn-glycerol 3-phosphate transport system permease protein